MSVAETPIAVSMSDSERGQVTVLALGLSVVSFAVAGLAVDAARTWVHKRTLQAAADAAAISGASGVDEGRFYSDGGTRAVLDPQRVEVRVVRLLEQRGLRASVRVEPRPGWVRVWLGSEIETTFLSLVGIERVPVAAEAVARPFFGDP